MLLENRNIKDDYISSIIVKTYKVARKVDIW